MYRIVNVVDGNEYILHDQRDKRLTVIEPRLVLTLNKTGSLEFGIPADHMYYHTLKKLKSSIQLFEDGVLIYEGRIFTDVSDFYNTRSIMCEGSMGFLLDSMQRPFVVSDKSPREFLKQMIESHNSQVEERKRFVLGLVNVEDVDVSVVRENQSIEKTWNILNKHLVDMLGGYLWVSYENEKKVINYTWDYGGYNEQEIRFGVNLLDLTKHQDATNIFTRVIPTGAEIEYKDALGEKQTKVVDITSVNDGKDYLDAEQSAIDEYGYITTPLNWPTITDPEKLKMKAAAYLRESIQIPENLKISAVDLNYAGVDIQRFKLGYYTKAISRQHNLEKEMLLTRLDLYLDNPQKGSIDLGGTQATLTSSFANQKVTISKAVQKVAENASKEINRKVENATKLITGGLGGYFVIDDIDPVTGKKTHPWRILIMNTPDKATAVNVIQMNQNGIGFSTTGINGPYRNAWTIDGNLVADFITTGTMLADRIRGGELELGGSGLGRDGKIIVKGSDDKTIGYWDKTGFHLLKGTIKGTTIEVGPFIAEEDSVWIGDFFVSADGSNILQSADGTVSIQTAEGGPYGSYTVINLSSKSGTTELSDHHLNTGAVVVIDVTATACNLAHGKDGVWGLGTTIDWFWAQYEDLESRVSELENML